jgi:hypothetical protein
VYDSKSCIIADRVPQKQNAMTRNSGYTTDVGSNLKLKIVQVVHEAIRPAEDAFPVALPPGQIITTFGNKRPSSVTPLRMDIANSSAFCANSQK